jgi:hypothetical protein
MGYNRDSPPSAMIEAAYEHHHINARYLNCGYSEARGRLSAPEIFKDFPDRDALPQVFFAAASQTHCARPERLFSGLTRRDH